MPKKDSAAKLLKLGTAGLIVLLLGELLKLIDEDGVIRRVRAVVVIEKMKQAVEAGRPDNESRGECLALLETLNDFLLDSPYREPKLN